MFAHLLESAARAPSRNGWTVTSAAAHAALVALAVGLTLSDPPHIVEQVRPEKIFFAAPRAPQRTQPPIHHRGSPSSWHAPTEIPITLPPVPEVSFPTDTHLRSIGPDTIGTGLTVGTSHGVFSNDRVYTEHLVERTVVPRRDNPQPVYPAPLRAAFVEGNVLVQFVVDTAGLVEAQSTVVLRATHPLFAEAVRRWLARTRYTPAEVGGRPVRQLVQQEVGFTLHP